MTAGRTKLLLAIGIPVVVVLVLAALGISLLVKQSVRSAVVGDCLSYTESSGSVRRADCDSPKANYRLYGIVDDIRACADAIGTSRAAEAAGRTYCFGEKDTDPATAINGAKAGDCLKITDDDAVRATCAAGTYPVIFVLDNQLKSSADDSSLAALCDGKPKSKDVAVAYGWSITTDESQAVGTWDRVFCLADER